VIQQRKRFHSRQSRFLRKLPSREVERRGRRSGRRGGTRGSPGEAEAVVEAEALANGSRMRGEVRAPAATAPYTQRARAQDTTRHGPPGRRRWASVPVANRKMCR